MPRINEHTFRLNNEEYLLTWYDNDKPRLTKNGNKQQIKPLLREYIMTKKLPIQLVNSKGNHEVTYTLASKILEHFSDNTIKIQTISNSTKVEVKPTLKNTTCNMTYSTVNISTSSKQKLYLIPCSSDKNENQLVNKKFELERLEFNAEIGKYREELIRILANKKSHIGNNKNINNDFNFNQTAQAHKLYSKGKLYNINSSNSLNWTQKSKEKIYIISALFGIIRADDYIFMYDLAMTDEIDGDKNFAKKYWKGKLDLIIEKLSKNDTVIYNLLSKDYSDCIHQKLVNSLKTQEDLGISEIDINKNDRNSCPGKRGKWLNRDLNL
jgi:cytoplasmic iron level regulating protein YaaA (DUF328/UPF0246 family)